MEIYDREIAARLAQAIKESPHLSGIVQSRLEQLEGEREYEVLLSLEMLVRELAPEAGGFHSSFDFTQGGYARRTAQAILKGRNL